MNVKQFGQSVLPAVLVDCALNLAHQLFAGDNDNSWLSWAVGAVSLFVLPAWAGARVARFGGSWRWSCLGGLCLLLGTALLAVLSEFFEPVLRDLPLVVLFVMVLMLVPLYALLGFLGGKLSSLGKAHGA